MDRWHDARGGRLFRSAAAHRNRGVGMAGSRKGAQSNEAHEAAWFPGNNREAYFRHRLGFIKDVEAGKLRSLPFLTP